MVSPHRYSYKLWPYRLQFKFEAGTSRGVLTEKTTFFLIITDRLTDTFGIGEAGPLPKLSVDDFKDFENRVNAILGGISFSGSTDHKESIYQIAEEVIPTNFPSLKFAFETALLDLSNGGHRAVFENPFSSGTQSIQINGLIWMGDEAFMLRQIEEKLSKGFSCLKLKIGALDFDKECRILKFIRANYTASELELRVDANGAFQVSEAMDKLKKLSAFEIHSIEQPIRQGQFAAMAELCEKSPIPIALDEELIGVTGIDAKQKMLKTICPQYIILKPTLLGGFKETEEWIRIAEEMDIAWWITSALESNIGLSAISQFVAQFSLKMPQGLGTGQLYENNLPSPLSLNGEWLSYNLTQQTWDLTQIEGAF